MNRENTSLGEFRKIRVSLALAWVTRARGVCVAVPALLVIIGTLFVFDNLRTEEHDKLRARFDGQAQAFGNGLDEDFNVYLEIVQSITSFYSASTQVDQDEFNAFVERDLSKYGAIQALEWVPLVKHEKRAEYEHLMQQNGFEGFQFKQWTPGAESTWTATEGKWSEEYYPVYYMQPYEGNEPEFGIDLGSNPTHRAAIEQARETGKAVATTRIELAQESSDPPGVILIVPVYSNKPTAGDAEPDSHSASSETPQGFALGVLRIAYIVNAVAAERDLGGIHLRVIDASVEDGQQLIFDSRHPGFPGEFKTVTDGSLQFSYPFDFASRQWQFQFIAQPEYVQRHASHQALWVLIVGFLLAIAIAVTVDLAIRRLRRERADELERAIVGRESESNYRQLAEHRLEEKVMELESRGKELESSQLATLNMMEDVERSRRRLSTANEALKQSNQDLEQFAFIASHDLQEPLRKVASFCGLLREEYGDKLDEDGIRYAEFAVDGATRMRGLIQDLLAFSKVGSEKNFTTVDTTVVLEAAIANLETSISESNATVTYDELPPVDGIERELCQLFQNLIGNALKYRTDQPPEIHVSASPHEDDWHFSVSDNGIGIAPEYHERIFGIFKRLHSKTEFSGTGIGLAICKRVVDGLDGKIWVEPREGPGSTICFSIPKTTTIATAEGANYELASTAK